ADCNGNPADGCEVNLQTSVGNCGGCGNACSAPNGTPGCSAGSCTVASCNAGFANCNGSPLDGCEVSTNTSVGNCGGCGNACTVANGTPSCVLGSCGIASCNAGFQNCNGSVADGCEINTVTSVGNCGACGNVCTAPNGTPTCVNSTCGVSGCSAPF